LGSRRTDARVDTGAPGTLFIERATPGFIRQYFQAGVLEFHPGTASPVRLALLGDDLRETIYPGGGWTLIRSFLHSDPVTSGATLDFERIRSGVGPAFFGDLAPPRGYGWRQIVTLPPPSLAVCLAFGPDGRLYVGTSDSRVLAFGGTDREGPADAPEVFVHSLDNVNEPRGIAFAQGNVYVSARRKVIRFRDYARHGTGQ